MRSLVIFGAQGAAPAGGYTEQVTVDGARLPCAIVHTPPPAFASDAPEHAHAVLVQVHALSCNFRDRGFFQVMKGMPGRRFSPLGSEFAGEVVAVGAAVSDLRVGDRVMPNHHYTGGQDDGSGAREGVITNQASRELQVVPASKLIRLPAAMPFAEAAAFSLGAQTAYSMVRRLDLQPGERALVTSAASNTSHFLIHALRSRGAEVTASTSSERFHARIEALGVSRVLTADQLSADRGDYHHVLDPFFDLHLARAVTLLRPFGKYITCGLAAQNAELALQRGGVDLDATKILGTAIMKNLSIVGNCIGLRADLERAVEDYSAGLWAPVLDSTYAGDDVSAFLDRSFNDRTRFGKVIFRYDN